MDPFTIIVDTREQQPWEFGLHTTSRKKLDTGEYSIEGLEQLLTIERKKSVSEIANNITESRFKDVLQRMSIIPYKLLPKLGVIELMYFCVMWMNSFPVKSEISEKWSPREIVSRHKLDAKIHYKVPFGVYCEVHVNPDITNTMEPRSKLGNMSRAY